MSDLRKYDRFILFDTETTSIKPNFIISLSFRYHDREDNHEIGEILCNPLYKINPKASEINGYTDEKVKEFNTFKNQWKSIEHYFVDSVWIGHNMKFDSSALALELKRAGFQIPTHYELDTLPIAKKMIKKPDEISDHKLITLCKYFDLDLNEEELHGSAYDILMTEKVFKKLKDLNEKEGGKYDELFKPRLVFGDYSESKY